MQKAEYKYIVMGFGLGGNSGDGIDSKGLVFSSSWYLKPDQLQTYIDNGHYPAGQMNDCILIDKRAALEADMALAFDSPMLGVKLAEGETSRMLDLLKHDSAALVMSAVGEHNATVAALTAKSLVDESFIGLDKVGPAASIGQTPVTLATVEAKLEELGYRLNRMLDCRSLARWMSGPRVGKRYPVVTTGITEVSTGLSFANANAERGENFQRLQELRLSGKLFAVIRGCILEI